MNLSNGLMSNIKGAVTDMRYFARSKFSEFSLQEKI